MSALGARQLARPLDDDAAAYLLPPLSGRPIIPTGGDLPDAIEALCLASSVAIWLV